MSFHLFGALKAPGSINASTDSPFICTFTIALDRHFGEAAEIFSRVGRAADVGLGEDDLHTIEK